MSNHKTVGELIDLLKDFPRDMKIANHICLYWFYPLELKEYQNRMQKEDYDKLTREEALDLCIFEGSWEDGSVVDHEDMMRQLLKKYYEEEL